MLSESPSPPVPESAGRPEWRRGPSGKAGAGAGSGWLGWPDRRGPAGLVRYLGSGPTSWLARLPDEQEACRRSQSADRAFPLVQWRLRPETAPVWRLLAVVQP